MRMICPLIISHKLVHNLFRSAIYAHSHQVWKHASIQKNSVTISVGMAMWLQWDQHGEIKYFTSAKKEEKTQ